MLQASLPPILPSVLQASTASEGFLVQGAVRALATPEEGARFVSETLRNLPRGWDLLDAFERFDFGPWRPDGRKDINASLRSMGMFRTRWSGSKFDALWHPIPSRSTVVFEYDRLLEEGELSPSRLLENFPGAPLTLARIDVETFALETFLEREDWLDRLWPKLSPLESRERALELAGHGSRVRDSARRVSERLSLSGALVLNSPE